MAYNRDSATYNLPFTIYQRGFTIVELLVVIVVIGILAAITIISYTGISQRATIASIQTDLTNASNIFKLDQVTAGNYPLDLASANSNKGISSCTGTTTCFYAVNNSLTPQGFCLAVTKNLTTYRITNDSAPTAGDCQSYGLIVSLDASNTTSYPSPFTGIAWNDLSGNGLNGALYNGVAYSSANSGNLVFDGVDDYVDLGDNANFRNLSNITLSAWVNIDNLVDAWNYILGKSGFWGNNEFGFYTSGAKLGVSIDGDVGSRAWVEYVYSANIGQWHYLTTTYDGSNVKLYVDGALIGSSTTSGKVGNNTDHLYVGRATNLYYTKQSVGSVQLFNRSMPITEIQQIFDNTKGRYGL